MIEIIPLLELHWTEIKTIYEQGISTGNATFQTTAPDWPEWDADHIESCRIVAIADTLVLGWAGLTPVSGRCVYGGVAEVSVYVSEKARGKGLGTLLLKELVKRSELEKFWTLQAGIFPENAGSLRIHEKAGFRQVGIRERIGKMNGIWRDTVLMERRSPLTGV